MPRELLFSVTKDDLDIYIKGLNTYIFQTKDITIENNKWKIKAERKTNE